MLRQRIWIFLMSAWNHKRRFVTFLVFANATIGLAFTAPVSAQGATFTVNSTIDAPDVNPGDGACAVGNGECTLRAAIQESNALPGPNQTTLPGGTYVIRTDVGFGENASVSGDLDITGDLEISGAGAADTFIDGGIFINSGNHEATFEIRSGSALVSNLAIQNGGSFFGLGGAIRNFGTLTLSGVVVRDNIGDAAGVLNFSTGTLSVNTSTFIGNEGLGGQSAAGGILNLGMAILNGVVFSSNGAAFGGAILNGGTLTGNNITVEDGGASMGGGILNANLMTLSNSTIRGNIVFFSGGGGIFNDFNGNLILSNSTVSGNTASGFGGAGINNRGTATLLNVTITGNAALAEGGGIYNDELIFPRALTLKNTIIADNGGGDCAGPTPVVSEGHNLSSDATCGFSGPGDLQNMDPVLGPLADNGGPTQTHALLPGSPAIDAGDNRGCPETDQRGFSRPFDGDVDGQALCDIGAYELHHCLGDVNSDGVVDVSDARLVARSIPSRPGSPRWLLAADVNGDGVVDDIDLRVVVHMLVARTCA